jgi:hypothetical protein
VGRYFHTFLVCNILLCKKLHRCISPRKAEDSVPLSICHSNACRISNAFVKTLYPAQSFNSLFANNIYHSLSFWNPCSDTWLVISSRHSSLSVMSRSGPALRSEADGSGTFEEHPEVAECFKQVGIFSYCEKLTTFHQQIAGGICPII